MQLFGCVGCEFRKVWNHWSTVSNLSSLNCKMVYIEAWQGQVIILSKVVDIYKVAGSDNDTTINKYI